MTLTEAIEAVMREQRRLILYGGQQATLTKHLRAVHRMVPHLDMAEVRERIGRATLAVDSATSPAVLAPATARALAGKHAAKAVTP